MREGWKEVVLGDVVNLIGGGTPKRSIDEYWNGDIPWLSVKDFNNDLRYVKTSEERITQLGLEKSSTKILSNGQIIISARGTIGALAQVNYPMAFNQSCYGIDGKKDDVENDYLYYLLKYSIDGLKLISHGAVFDTITKETFQHIIVNLPPLAEQKAIAHILGKLDDKIELNRQMNQTLEEMAQALFQSWFVDFDPVIDNALAAGNEIPEELQTKAEQRKAVQENGKQTLPENLASLFPNKFIFNEVLNKWIPEGWEVKSLGSEFEFLNGNAFKSKELLKDPGDDNYHVFKMGNIERGGGFKFFGTKSYFPKKELGSLEKYLLKKGDVLMAMTDMKSNMALLGHTALMPLNNVFLVNQRVGTLREKEDSYLGYSYLYLFTNHPETITEIRSRSNSGVQVNLSTSEIKATPLIMPSKEIHDYFNSQVSKMYDKTFALDEETKTLTQLRDVLLPQLISGKLSVPEAMLEVEKVLGE